LYNFDVDIYFTIILRLLNVVATIRKCMSDFTCALSSRRTPRSLAYVYGIFYDVYQNSPQPWISQKKLQSKLDFQSDILFKIWQMRSKEKQILNSDGSRNFEKGALYKKGAHSEITEKKVFCISNIDFY
jgi:hypothetical protein